MARCSLAGSHPADEDDVGGLGDEAAAEDRQDRVAVEVRLRVEREGVERLEHRETGILNAALDAPLPAPGHLQVSQLREVVGWRLTLAGGLLGQRPPLRRDRRQTQRLQIRRQMRRLRQSGPISTSSPARHRSANVGVGTFDPRQVRTHPVDRPAHRWRAGLLLPQDEPHRFQAG